MPPKGDTRCAEPWCSATIPTTEGEIVFAAWRKASDMARAASTGLGALPLAVAAGWALNAMVIPAAARARKPSAPMCARRRFVRVAWSVFMVLRLRTEVPGVSAAFGQARADPSRPGIHLTVA